MTAQFSHIIGLGVDCRVRFQASRFFDQARSIPPGSFPQTSLVEPEVTMVGTNFFDWNMAWFHQVIRAFENRFADLCIVDRLLPLANQPDVAVDGVYEFRYSHLFHHKPGLAFADMVAGQYRAVSRIVFHLRDKLLAHVAEANPTLYVRCQGYEHEAVRFCEMMRRVYPAHRFHLLLVDMQDETAGFTALHPDYSIYRMASRVRKSPAAAWTGDDGEWDGMFRQIFAALGLQVGEPAGDDAA